VTLHPTSGAAAPLVERIGRPESATIGAVSAIALQSTLPARAHHLPAAGLAGVAVALLAGLPEVLGDLGRLAAVLVLQLGLVLAWVLVTGVQGFAGSLAVGAAAAVAADLALVLPGRSELGEVLVVFGLGFIAVVLRQMFRRQRTDLVASLSGELLLICAVGALAVFLLLDQDAAEAGWARIAVPVAGAALVAGHLVDLVLPRPNLATGVPRGPAGLAAAVLAGTATAVLGAMVGDLPGRPTAAVHGVVLAAVVALVALAASYVVVEVTSSADGGPQPAGPAPWSRAVLQVVLPLAACAPVALALQATL
jgi:hypothetical protein